MNVEYKKRLCLTLQCNAILYKKLKNKHFFVPISTKQEIHCFVTKSYFKMSTSCTEILLPSVTFDLKEQLELQYSCLMQSWIMLSATYCDHILKVPLKVDYQNIGSCYYLVIVINNARSQSDHIKRLRLFKTRPYQNGVCVRNRRC